jgi:prolyl oligopeptidase
MKYPLTAKTDTVDVYFGTEVPDPYRWLEDDNSAETKDWVIAQNEVTDAFLETIPFRESIRQRLEKLWNYPRMGAPFREGDYYFYTFNNGLQNQDVIFIKSSLEAEGTVFLDPNTFSGDGTVSLTAFSVSKDGKYVGYGISRGGSDWNEFFVKEIATGNQLDDHLKWIKFSGLSWYKDGFFYNRYNEPKAGDQLKGKNVNSKLYYHKAGTSQDKDVLVYEDPQHPARSFNGSVSQDETYLIISVVESTTGNAVYYKDLTNRRSEITPMVETFDKDYGYVGNVGSRLYFLTNLDAPKYRLVAMDVADENPQWIEIIPENKDMVLTGVQFANGNLIAGYQKDAHDLLFVYSKQGELMHEIVLPGVGTVGGISAKDKYEEIFYVYTSFNYPATIFKYDMKSNTSTLYYKPDVDFDSGNYETKQVFYTSKDGTQVPMFIVHRKGLKLDGKRPTLLYGYGGFNVTYTPAFSIRNLIWLENDGIYVLANIRGGGEYGEEWHQAGTILKKQNVFDDFIAAAEYLIDNKYTSNKKLAIFGGSNGGLLVGAVTNQRPDLFAVAIPAVGVMDMLRFHKFTIGHYWVTDYGSSEDSVQFEYLYKYSPLHNIKSGVEYPAVMVTTADHDDRVVPAHSFKYIATLQEKHTGKNPVLIRIETDAGHGAGKPISKSIEELADMWSFAFYCMNVTPVYMQEE